jgi:hypothetical protein
MSQPLKFLYMKYLAAFVLIITLAGLPSCQFFREKVFGKKTRALAAEKARLDSIRVADSLDKVQERLRALEQARLDSISRAENDKLPVLSRYNIIVGSFLTPEFARSLAQEYTSMGYKTQILKGDNGNFEFVAAEGYDDLGTARRRLSQFQDTVQIESWIYVKK